MPGSTKAATAKPESVDDIISRVIEVEGSDYTNDPSDSGGPTRFGITLSVLRKARGGGVVTASDVAALTEIEARSIYRKLYVVDPGFEMVLRISNAIGVEVIDSGVNCGQPTAAMWLQRCLNALNRQEQDYPDVRVDGNCGPRTIAALQSFIGLRRGEGVDVLLGMLNSLQGAHYIRLAEGRPKDERFVYGWFLNRVVR